MTNINQPDFQLLFDIQPGACILLNRHLEILAVSNAFLEVTYTQRDLMIGKRIIDVFPDNPKSVFVMNAEQVRQDMHLAFETGEVNSSSLTEYDIPGPDGRFLERYWSKKNVPVRNNKGEVEWIIHCIADVTDAAMSQEWMAKMKESNTLAEELRLLSGYLHDLRERERARVAREIHDVFGQQLSVIKMGVSWLLKKCEGNELLQNKTHEINEMLKESISLVRRLSTELRPSILDDMGLVAAMEWQLGEFDQKSGITTHFTSGEEPDISNTLKLNIFRVLQECLDNVFQHVGAKNVWVYLGPEGHVLKFSITDDGMCVDNILKPGQINFGLRSMEERTMMLGGHYKISISPEGRTTVEVTFNC